MASELSYLKEDRVTRLYLAALAGLAVLRPQVLLAQTPNDANDSVQVGDRWVYDSKDEITGFPKDTFTLIVTEVSPKEVVVSFTLRGKSGSSLLVFDHDWNRTESPTVKFKPNDGQGIRLPLSVGKEWRSEFETRNMQTGHTSKDTVASKVVAQESLTTPAGTFETFKIETRVREIDAADPSKLWELENVGWYAPQINHWVRRIFLSKYQKRTRANTTEELADFSRKF
jgi:hypothetical protein